VGRYLDSYVKVDPSTVRQFFGEIGQELSTEDLMSYDEFLDTRFSAEWARPQHLADALSIVLDKSGSHVMLFTVFRDADDGLVDAGARRRMGMLAPHLQRASLVTRAVAASSARAAALADTLDAVGAGIFLLDRNGTVVHANITGRSMLSSGQLFQARSERLALVEARSDRILAATLAGFAAGVGTERDGRTAILILDRHGGSHIAHFLPLGAGTRASGLPPGATLAVFVRPASFGGVSAPEALARAYRLTPTELRVLLAVVDGGGVSNVADTLGVAESTVKFHLRRLFEKTGARRQSELVRIAAGFSAPLLG
jgi:DNA-binding CsgD family transcriptional regulator